MRAAKLAQILLSATVVGLVAPPVAVAASQWMLMSRHGECVEIETLRRRIPDLGAVGDPYSFIKLMRQRGHQVSSNEVPQGRGKAVEVKVPEKELSLIFVAPELCEKAGAK
jgi:hypothetical protein